MAKNQNLTPYQQGIVKRYYEHKDTLGHQKVAEIVSELYLAEADGSKKKADKLWKSAHTALLNSGANKVLVEKIVADRDLKALAELVNKSY